ncbi:hypothetical protein Amal_03916 [Acetobacter malorum]|uniref:Uncharacterized protein n=1 Tax=Acetobacter malorum TaxID=178901 RepID=A0A177G3K2_9PROT|nr:hypothetical protein Amal_03916 [Acetobacter malorum]
MRLRAFRVGEEINIKPQTAGNVGFQKSLIRVAGFPGQKCCCVQNTERIFALPGGKSFYSNERRHSFNPGPAT